MNRRTVCRISEITSEVIKYSHGCACPFLVAFVYLQNYSDFFKRFIWIEHFGFFNDQMQYANYDILQRLSVR